MKTRLAMALCSTLWVLSGTVVRAVCVGPSVNSFGAKGDGHTDDTALGPYPDCLVGGTVVSGVQRRNSFRAPKFVWTDFAITKNTKVPGWDKATLGIGFQFFNLFNHTNFEGSDNFMSNPTFGEITYLIEPPTGILGTSAPQRMIQLKAQLRF